MIVSEKHKKITVFSAYWPVERNPKPTAKIGHLKTASKRDLDYFICPQNQKVDFRNKICLDFDLLPSSSYIKNLTSFCESRKKVFTKFGTEIESDVFLKLATIWTSKVLLFQKMMEYTDADYLMWVDCVMTTNLDLITSNDSDRCCINRYGKEVDDKNYGGLMKNTLPPIKILAQVIKLPRYIVMDFVEKYIECLQFTDNNFSIYDEEIVLTLMHQKYPRLFNIIE